MTTTLLLPLGLPSNLYHIGSLPTISSPPFISLSPPLSRSHQTHIGMDKHETKHGKAAISRANQDESSRGEAINMNEQEEDLIYRMYRLVGKRWDLIAGRIPGRTPEDIERFWRMRQRQGSGKNKG